MSKSKTQTTFLFHFAWMAMIEDLNEHEKLMFINAIHSYAKYHILPEWGSNKAYEALWKIIKEQMDADIKKRIKISVQNRINVMHRYAKKKKKQSFFSKIFRKGN